MAYFIELAHGDTLLVGKDTRIVLEKKSGQRARLRIESAADIERVKAGDPIPSADGQPMARVTSSR